MLIIEVNCRKIPIGVFVNSTLLIFTKYPHPGTVKTRLAATVGQALATEFHARSAENTFRQAVAVQDAMDVSIWYAGSDDHEVMRHWLEESNLSFPIIPQSGKDLGERLHHAVFHAFEANASTVLIIGTDTPDISPELLREAQLALRTKDIVLGPAFDGGYYLLGMNRYSPTLFEDIAWSSSGVAIETIQKAHDAQLSVAMLDPLLDIDTIEDVRQWLRLETTREDHPLYPLVYQLNTHE